MRLLISLSILFLIAGCTARQSAPATKASTADARAWEAQNTPVAASLRGLHAVNSSVVWASGSEGTWLRTIDGGKTWQSGRIPGDETLDFRDVHALDANTAFVLSAGRPARIYHTTDGGETWALRYANDSPGVFFDGLVFVDQRRGIAFSDPIRNSFLIITTRDGGLTWHQVPPERLPAPLPGEAGFAASGTAIASFNSNVWIGTGGSRARVLRWIQADRSWQIADTPILAGKPSAGIFSITFWSERHGVAVGGDYEQPDQTDRNAAFTEDGGRTWSLVRDQPPRGYRSCVAHIPNTSGPILVAVGTNGGDISYDGGRSWQPLSDEGFHAIDFAADGTGWAVGPAGHVARYAGPRSDSPASGK